MKPLRGGRFLSWWRRRQSRRRLAALTQHAVSLRNLREDLMSPTELERLRTALTAARGSLRTRGSETTAIEAVGADLDAVCLALTPPRRFSGVRENFEVLLVALSVAMAFRAYFFQPFKIPTGSMQPALYGIHSEAKAVPGIWDRMPLKPVQWLWTGAWYRRVVIEAHGELIPFSEIHSEERPPERPGYAGFLVAGRRYYVPSDADVGPLRVMDPTGNRIRRRFRRGDVLWSGVVRAGDQVFVNRMAWNFLRPRRGDVMVFSTDGIPNLQPGTHYIKRLCGMPGEAISINPPWLMVNGRPVMDSPRITRIAQGEQLASWAPPFTGYRVIGHVPEGLENPTPLVDAGDVFSLSDHQYFALGDNTGNSFDSRYFGAVSARNLVGPAMIVYWPFASPRWGWMR